jgi:phage repressor protein C with HTH and peptisase S24 domain
LQADNSYSRKIVESSYFAGMKRVQKTIAEPVRKLILARAATINKTLAELSLGIGKNHAYLQQFINRDIPLRLGEEVRHRLAPLLGVDEMQLRGAGFPSIKKQSAAAPSPNAVVAGATRIASTIPAYGHAMGGKDGQFVLNGNKVADVLAPPSLSSVPEAYAVYVVGLSMEPRYFAGEAVFVNPRLPVRKDDFVVAQIAADVEGDPPLAYIKRFVSMDSKALRLTQFNPRKTLEFSSGRVVSVHRIVMGGDG